MADISVGQEKLQVAAPQRQMARRQPLDLTSAFGTVAETFGGVNKARAKRKEEQQKLAINQAAQETILQSEQTYLSTRDSLIAAGQWDQEAAFQLKNRSRMDLRRKLVENKILDKGLVEHAESQLAKVYVDGEWKVDDSSIYFKVVTSPNGNVSTQLKSTDESFASALLDRAKTNPAVGKSLAHAMRGGEVRDREGNLMLDKAKATELFVASIEAEVKLEQAKSQLQQRMQLAEVKEKELGMLEKGVEWLRPQYEDAVRTRADIISRHVYANFDPATSTKEQMAIDIAAMLKRDLNSESFASFDTGDAQGRSVNNVLRSEYRNKVDAIAKEYAERLFNSRTTDPDLAKNVAMQEHLFNMARAHGAAVLAGHPYIKKLEEQIVRMRKGPFSSLMISDPSKMDTTLLSSIVMGDKMRYAVDEVYWRLNNAQSLSEIEMAEAKLRVADPGTIEFERNLMILFNNAKTYADDIAIDGRMIDHSVGYISAQLAMKNPKLRDHLTKTGKTMDEIRIIEEALQSMSVMSKNALEQQDKMTKWDLLPKYQAEIEAAVKGSFIEEAGPLVEEKEEEPEKEEKKFTRKGI